MNLNLLLFFIILNILNVILHTIKSIYTIKGSKITAAAINAIAYGLYTIVVIYMTSDLPLLLKVIIVGLCNFIGVYIVKYIEEKKEKEKLWKIEFTINKEYLSAIRLLLKEKNISNNYNIIGNKLLFNTYCDTKQESKEVEKIIKKFNAKYCIMESKKF